MSEVEFQVRGQPVPQGSMVRGKYGPIRYANDIPLKAWRTAIANECRIAMRGLPAFPGAVRVYVTFVVARPRSHKRTSGELRASAPMHPAGRPDVDKLARACLDAITAVAVDDDSQVVQLFASKTYSDSDTPVGAFIRIVEMQAKEEAA